MTCEEYRMRVDTSLRMNGRTGRMDGRMGWLDGWTDGLDGWMDGRTAGRTGWMDGWIMDGQVDKSVQMVQEMES